MSVTAAAGFVAAGGAVGIKASGAPDLAIVATVDGRPVTAAGTFTQNLAAAGPVRVSQRHLTATGGRAAAIVLNSGNANCATGDDVAVAEAMAATTAAAVGCDPTEVLICSTGLIGIPLAAAVVTAGIAAVAPTRSADGGHAAAVALMTTDTRSKEAVATGGGATVGGMAKGAAMLAPQMAPGKGPPPGGSAPAIPHATMLAVLTTDAEVDPLTLTAVLGAAVDVSFNRVVVDGCTSTNDTVLALASGAAGPPSDHDAFAAAVAEVCGSLARQMAEDAEGHTKVVTVEITGAADDAEADRAARALATSLLVKCSFYGSDPYWGRVLSDLGTAGVALDVDAVTVAYGGHVVSRGLSPAAHDKAGVTAAVSSPAFTLACDLGVGDGAAWVLTNDLTHAYVDENMGTS